MSTDYFAAFPILILLIVGGIFAHIFRRKDRMHASEAGKKPLFTETCAGVIGWLTYKGPFIRLAIYSDFMIVSCDKQYYLPFSSITKIERKSFLFTKGYRIHHRNADMPERIELWLNGRDRFEAACEGKVVFS